MAIYSAQTSPLILDQNGFPVQNGYRSVQSGNVSVTSGTPVALSSIAEECKRIDIIADYNNTDVLVVGGSGVSGPEVSRKGIPLTAGKAYTIFITDVSQVWVDAGAGTQKGSFNYFW